MNMIEVRNLKKRFGDTQVLDGVSFSVEKGQTVAIIGPSGSGKSTLLRCLIGLEHADDGDIFIEGEPFLQNGVYISEILTRRVCIKMGMVFQSFNLFPHLSVMENLVSAPIAAKKATPAAAIVHAMRLLDEVGLTGKELAFPRELSGGQKQRVAIARALMMDPDMLLFDEPTSSLDPQLTAEVLAVMRRLTEQRMTMVVVTHEMGFAREAADKVLFMCDREIIGNGSTAEIFEHSTDPRIRNFIDSIL